MYIQINKKTIFAAFIIAAIQQSTQAATIGYWRFDEAGAIEGNTISAAISEVNSPTLNAFATQTPSWNSDVPGSNIYDPVTDQNFANAFSSHHVNAERHNVPKNALLDTPNAFTIEAFVKFPTTEYGGWVQMVRRNVSNTDRWIMQMTHANDNNYGAASGQFDINGFTENIDSSTGPGNTRLMVDTDGGTGDPADYTGGDPFLQGDGTNDNPVWRHVAITMDFSGAPGTHTHELFVDYVSVGTQTIAGSFSHPDANLQIGPPFGNGGELLIDEVRYSDAVLNPSLFLRAQPIPEPGVYGLLLGTAVLALCAVRRLESKSIE